MQTVSLWDEMGFSNSPTIKLGNSVNDKPRTDIFAQQDSIPATKVDVEQKLVTTVFEPQQGYTFERRTVRTPV
jgi:hypothetical protein